MPGRPQDQSPYQSELAGIMMPVMATEWMAQLIPSIPKPGPIIRLGCDGLSALKQCFEDITISPTDPQFDLVSSIRSLLHRSPFQWRPLHILGHQDIPSDEPLTWWELRNTEVDQWAVAYRIHLDPGKAKNPPNPRLIGVMKRLPNAHVVARKITFISLGARHRAYNSSGTIDIRNSLAGWISN